MPGEKPKSVKTSLGRSVLDPKYQCVAVCACIAPVVVHVWACKSAVCLGGQIPTVSFNRIQISL